MSASTNGKILRGAMTALVTPFRDGAVDQTALRCLIDHQIQAGTDVLVPCGTTGEAPTLTAGEQSAIIETVVSCADGRRTVLAGTGSNCTTKTIEATKRAVGAGADAALVVAPYYNRPTQDGIYWHYASIAEAVEIPLVLYNVPKRCGVEIAVDTIVRLRSAFPHVVAVKHATGSLETAAEIHHACDIDVLSGDDALTLGLMAQGAVGVISVIGNLVPAQVKALVDHMLAQDLGAARPIHRRLFALVHEMNGLGPNPVPIKTALALCGRIREEFRLPLTPPTKEVRSRLESLLRRQELLTKP